jgi:hypothetical protein
MINATSSSACACTLKQNSPTSSNANSTSTTADKSDTSAAADSFSSSSPLLAKATTSSSGAPPSQPVAVNKTGTLASDQKVHTATGGAYNFKQPGTYNLLADKNVNLNAKVEGQPALVTQAGLKLGTRELTVKADGTAQLGNGPFAIVLQDGQTIKLADGSSISKNGSEITASTPEYKIVLKASDTTKDHLAPHLDVKVQSKDKGVMADNAAPTGVLGEGFSADSHQQNAAMLDASTYKRNGLFDNSVNAATQALSKQHLAAAKGQTQNPPPPTNNTNLMFMLRVMTLFIQMFQNMFQILGQGSSTRAA